MPHAAEVPFGPKQNTTAILIQNPSLIELGFQTNSCFSITFGLDQSGHHGYIHEMTRSIGYCTLLVSAAIAIVLAVYEPTLLSDDNAFLNNFVNHEFLNLLGVILAITLASTAQLHLTLNKIEETYKQRGGLNKTRGGVQKAAHSLIGLFLGGVAIVIIKPLLATAPWQQSVFNSIAIIIIIWNVLLLINITRTIFKIDPVIDE